MKKLRAFPLRAVLRKTLGSLVLLIGVLGFIPLAVDPIPWFASLFPVHLDTVFGLIHIEQAYAQGLMTTLHTDGLVLGATAGVSALMVLVAGILLVQDPLHAVKSLGSGIKASPMAILRSPVTTYKRIVRVRNWILEKVEYLQSESAKWKTTFNIIKAPYSLLRAMGFSPQMATTFLLAGSVAGTTVGVAEVLADKSFSRGDTGVYSAPADVPVVWSEDYNTLRIDLGSTPVREITIENVSVGTVFTGSALPSGQQNVVQISGNTISGGTNTRLEVGHLIFEKSRCKKLELSDIQAHTILIRGNASDGQSIAPSPGTSRMLAIGGGHQQAEAMVTSGGLYDRIWIQAPTSGVNGRVGTLRLTNLYTKGGLCVLSKMNVGTLEILLNEIGMGDGFSTKEFSVATTVTGANITIEDNVEVTIAEPATS
jgi:hypothetical protein